MPHTAPQSTTEDAIKSNDLITIHQGLGTFLGCYLRRICSKMNLALSLKYAGGQANLLISWMINRNSNWDNAYLVYVCEIKVLTGMEIAQEKIIGNYIFIYRIKTVIPFVIKMAC